MVGPGRTRPETVELCVTGLYRDIRRVPLMTIACFLCRVLLYLFLKRKRKELKSPKEVVNSPDCSNLGHYLMFIARR